jgi:hypothetical protein
MSDPANWATDSFSDSAISDSKLARNFSEYVARRVAATDCLSGK